MSDTDYKTVKVPVALFKRYWSEQRERGAYRSFSEFVVEAVRERLGPGVAEGRRTEGGR